MYFKCYFSQRYKIYSNKHLNSRQNQQILAGNSNPKIDLLTFEFKVFGKDFEFEKVNLIENSTVRDSDQVNRMYCGHPHWDEGAEDLVAEKKIVRFFVLL